MLEGILKETNQGTHRDTKGVPLLSAVEAMSIGFPAFTLPAVLPTSAGSITALLADHQAQITEAAHAALVDAVARVERQAQSQVDARVLQLVEQRIQEQVNELVQQQVDNQVQDFGLDQVCGVGVAKAVRGDLFFRPQSMAT